MSNLIYCLQQVVQEVKKMIEADPDVPNDTMMNAIIVDHYLWDYRREHVDETADIPIHKTRSIYYWSANEHYLDISTEGKKKLCQNQTRLIVHGQL